MFFPLSHTFFSRHMALPCCDPFPPLSTEEARGEGRNKDGLDQQAQHRLCGSQASKGVSERHVLEKEATPVKATHTQDECLIPTEMDCPTMGVEQIETDTAEDHVEIGHQTPAWPIAIACYQIE